MMLCQRIHFPEMYFFFEVEYLKLLALVSDNSNIFPVLSTFSVQTYLPINIFSVLATCVPRASCYHHQTVSEERA